MNISALYHAYHHRRGWPKHCPLKHMPRVCFQLVADHKPWIGVCLTHDCHFVSWPCVSGRYMASRSSMPLGVATAYSKSSYKDRSRRSLRIPVVGFRSLFTHAVRGICMYGYGRVFSAPKKYILSYSVFFKSAKRSAAPRYRREQPTNQKKKRAALCSCGVRQSFKNRYASHLGHGDSTEPT